MEYGDGVMEVMERNGICYSYGVDGTPNGRVPIYNFKCYFCFGLFVFWFCRVLVFVVLFFVFIVCCAFV